MNLVRLFLAGLLVLTTFGCGSRSQSEYVPASTQARSALEAALNAWKSGKPYETVADHKPPVQTFDARWQAGAKLESFEILKELDEPDKSAPKKFVVKEQLAGGKAGEESTFYVLGKDPLHVFREVDYFQASGLPGPPAK